MSSTLINNLTAKIHAGTFLDENGKISIKHGFKL